MNKENLLLSRTTLSVELIMRRYLDFSRKTFHKAVLNAFPMPTDYKNRQTPRYWPTCKNVILRMFARIMLKQ